MCLTAPITPTYNLKVVGVYTEDNINITIKTHDDEFDMDIDPEALAKDVFEEYAEKNTIEFAGEELDMELTIEDNGIEDGATISIIAKEEEEIDQSSLMENTFKNPTSLEFAVNTRYYIVREQWWKPDGLGNATRIYERNIDMRHFITIKKRTPKTLKYVEYIYAPPSTERQGKIKTDEDGTEYIGDIDSPYENRYGIRADHLIKGENIHLFKGCVIHANGKDYHYN